MVDAPLLVAGLAVGAGVSSMHYTGMAALRTSASLSYDLGLVAVSIAIAVIASTAALWLTARANLFATRMAAAGVMVAAVCAMHYTAMAAARFAPLAPGHAAHLAASPLPHPSQSFLAAGVIFATLLVLCLGIAATYVDQRRAADTRRAAADLAAANEELAGEIEVRRKVQADLEGARQELADQRFDRLAKSMSAALFCTDDQGRITSWNPAAETIFGYAEGEALGQLATTIIPRLGRRASAAGTVDLSPQVTGSAFEATAVRNGGEQFPIELSLCTWTDNGLPAFGAIVRDITDRLRAQERLEALAYHDQLTGLPNRQAFADMLRSITQPADQRHATLLLLDLDGFKEVNDSRGHSCGDIALITCADRLRDSVPEGATVARLGGDEFAILLLTEGDVSLCIERILKSFEDPIHAGGRPFHLGTSIGAVSCPEHAADAEELLVNADLALYRAKSLGGNRCEFFTPALAEALQARHTMEAELLRAYKRGEFELYYQPLVRLSDGELVGAEALLRWHHREQGTLAPALFLPTLETTSVAEAIGNWVLETATTQGARWNSTGKALRMSVNLFGAQFNSGNLQAKVAHALRGSGLAADLLELEITENIALAHDESMIAPLQALRNLGIGIAFDDFGTGFGSMSMLKRFPVTRLKIDRSFVQDLTQNKDDVGIVRAIVALGKSLGLEVIAEGIEEDDQSVLLAKIGCSEGQGFYFGEPAPASVFEMMYVHPGSSVAYA
jgi:diguanylate cyclase (GGDEF)-like protein/PAS domain S-box-containing protein